MKAELQRRASYTADVLAYFTARPGIWIDSLVLMEVGGRMAWRTRVSDARKIAERDGWTVENRQWRQPNVIERDADGLPCKLWLGSIRSEYRYTPRTARHPEPVAEPIQAPLWGEAGR